MSTVCGARRKRANGSTLLVGNAAYFWNLLIQVRCSFRGRAEAAV